MTHGLEVYSHLDYLTVSFYYCDKPEQAINPVYEQFRVGEEIKPFPHYDRAWVLKCGGQLHLSENERQGGRLELKGQDLAQLRDSGISDDYLLRIIAESETKRRTTRIDYAFNVKNAGSVRHTVNHWRAKKIKTTFKKPPKGWVDFGTRKGQTVYFGSQHAAKFVRVYDKGTEMGLLNEALLRVELQVRDEYAQAMVTDAFKGSIASAGRTHLRDCLDFPQLRWWQEMLEGDNVEKTKIGRKMSDWQKWMSGQVFDSILKHVKNVDDGEFLETWLAKVALAVAAAETERQARAETASV